jgi:ADP-ribose pyrophosphatase YjhB (NUDIX family)
MEAKWLEWAKRIKAISQSGLTYTKDVYDKERYEQLRGIAAEIISEKTEAKLDELVELFSQNAGYATPKVDVRGAVFKDEKVLLVKEREDGGWTLPGGWADVCASAAENVVREVQEESGFETRVMKLAAVYDRSKHAHRPVMVDHIYKLFFICEIIGGNAKKGSETDDVGFFREEQLPELSISRVTQGQIQRMFEHNRNPDLPTDFD